jgi:hypothetical protein
MAITQDQLDNYNEKLTAYQGISDQYLAEKAQVEQENQARLDAVDNKWKAQCDAAREAFLDAQKDIGVI